MSQQCGAFCLINERSICAGNHQIRLAAKLGENFLDRRPSLALLSEICPAGDFLDLNETIAAQQNGAGAFAEDHSSRRPLEWFDRRLGPQETPPPVSIAEEPIGFFRAHHQTVIERFAQHQVLRHLQRQDPDSPIADQRVARAVYPKNRGQVAGGSVENRFGKKQRARSLGAGLNDVVIELLCVNDATV